MIGELDGKVYRNTYADINEWVATAKTYVDAGQYGSFRGEWTGVSSFDEVLTLARDGWLSEAPGAIAMAETAIATVTQEYDLPTIDIVHDVAGAVVDMGRYMTGDPECMMEFPPIESPNVGNVVTVCASIGARGGVSTAAIKRRGYATVALALTLDRMGFATELWVDSSCNISGGIGRSRTLLKGANDSLDVARIMFAYAHPGFFRGAVLPARGVYPGRMGVPGGGGSINPEQNLPDGTFYVPALITDSDAPETATALTRWLKRLGIIDVD